MISPNDSLHSLAKRSKSQSRESDILTTCAARRSRKAGKQKGRHAKAALCVSANPSEASDLPEVNPQQLPAERLSFAPSAPESSRTARHSKAAAERASSAAGLPVSEDRASRHAPLPAASAVDASASAASRKSHGSDSSGRHSGGSNGNSGRPTSTNGTGTGTPQPSLAAATNGRQSGTGAATNNSFTGATYSAPPTEKPERKKSEAKEKAPKEKDRRPPMVISSPSNFEHQIHVTFDPHSGVFNVRQL